jgi:hypothetical protein
VPTTQQHSTAQPNIKCFKPMTGRPDAAHGTFSRRPFKASVGLS